MAAGIAPAGSRWAMAMSRIWLAAERMDPLKLARQRVEPVPLPAHPAGSALGMTERPLHSLHEPHGMYDDVVSSASRPYVRGSSELESLAVLRLVADSHDAGLAIGAASLAGAARL